MAASTITRALLSTSLTALISALFFVRAEATHNPALLSPTEIVRVQQMAVTAVRRGWSHLFRMVMAAVALRTQCDQIIVCIGLCLGLKQLISLDVMDVQTSAASYLTVSATTVLFIDNAKTQLLPVAPSGGHLATNPQIRVLPSFYLRSVRALAWSRTESHASVISFSGSPYPRFHRELGVTPFAGECDWLHPSRVQVPSVGAFRTGIGAIAALGRVERNNKRGGAIRAGTIHHASKSTTALVII
jgi:hypothetical protein